MEMIHQAKFLFIFSIAGVLADPALCRSLPPSPYDPFRIIAETIAYLRMEQLEPARGDMQIANVRNLRLVRGQPIPLTFSLKLDGFCGAGNGPLAVRENYIVYLHRGAKQSDRYACQWVSKENAILRDPFVAAAFIEGDARIKMAAARRAEEVFRFQGPVPSTPLGQWPDRLTGELALRWIDAADRHELFRTRVEFKVGDDGRVGDCSDLMTRPMGQISETQMYANDRLCSWLKKVAQFKPPILPMERSGVMFWTWPPPVTPP